MAVKFEWDAVKARTNLRKHGISFEEARAAFLDPFAMFFGDPNHSGEERREIVVGRSDRRRLIFVSSPNGMLE